MVLLKTLPSTKADTWSGNLPHRQLVHPIVKLDYGVRAVSHLLVGTTMLLVLMLTSKGIAGVPRASLVVVAATCGMFKIPIEGIALILPIDHFCDMFRSATNVLGNALATSVVGKWEDGKEIEVATEE